MLSDIDIVFLDYDGVLNNWDFLNGPQRFANPDDKLDPKNVEVLNKIATRPNTFIVVSSTWRWGKTRTGLQDNLRSKGFKGTVLGSTPLIDDIRGKEIQRFLDECHYTIRSFVILDDNNDMVHLAPKLVLVDSRTGLTEANVESGIAILESV